MHHAAMANKREMMVSLARLGCDPRAQAAGIDGATAAFVLCAQHGKNTQQQVTLFQRVCYQVETLESSLQTIRMRIYQEINIMPISTNLITGLGFDMKCTS